MQRCARCHLGISASEMVMRARDSVYHLSCFTCSTCNKTLTTGDHFGMKDSLVYCRAHFETLLQGEYPPQLSYTELAAKSGGLALPYFNGTGTVQKGRPRKRKSPALGVDIVTYNSGGSPPAPGRPCRPSPGSAQRRIPSGFSPTPPWLQDGSFLSMALFSPQLSVTQKEAGGWSERKREEREGDGGGEREKGRERHLYFVCGQKYIHNSGAAATSPKQAGPNPCCPLVNEPISFWLPVGAKQPQGNSCVEAKL